MNVRYVVDVFGCLLKQPSHVPTEIHVHTRIINMPQYVLMQCTNST